MPVELTSLFQADFMKLFLCSLQYEQEHEYQCT
jgi:hypothetical protein